MRSYNHSGSHVENNAAETAEPYEYKDVDPRDYVGAKRVTRKESD